MHNANEESLTTREPGRLEPSRRNLLRLGAVAPMVLTLRPGSSFAASTTCTSTTSAADTARGEAANKLTADDSDEWVRAQVDLVELERVADTSEAAKIDGLFVLGTDGYTYWRVDTEGASTGLLMDSMKTTPRVTWGGRSALLAKTPGSSDFNTGNVVSTTVARRFALIRVDPETGMPLGYSWEPQAVSGILVSDGCFASMNMRAPFRGTFAELADYLRAMF